jgi:hypothetical protein
LFKKISLNSIIYALFLKTDNATSNMVKILNSLSAPVTHFPFSESRGRLAQGGQMGRCAALLVNK